MSYASRVPKVTRIFEVAEVIPGERALSVVSEENGSPAKITTASIRSVPIEPPQKYAAINAWAAGHKAKFDSIEERIKEVKADVLYEKSRIRR